MLFLTETHTAFKFKPKITIRTGPFGSFWDKVTDPSLTLRMTGGALRMTGMPDQAGHDDYLGQA